MKCLVSGSFARQSTEPQTFQIVKAQRTVSHEATKVAANDAVPGRALSLIKLVSSQLGGIA